MELTIAQTESIDYKLQLIKEQLGELGLKVVASQVTDKGIFFEVYGEKEAIDLLLFGGSKGYVSLFPEPRASEVKSIWRIVNYDPKTKEPQTVKIELKQKAYNREAFVFAFEEGLAFLKADLEEQKL
jgi:hypothetical protein